MPAPSRAPLASVVGVAALAGGLWTGAFTAMQSAISMGPNIAALTFAIFFIYGFVICGAGVVLLGPLWQRTAERRNLRGWTHVSVACAVLGLLAGLFVAHAEAAGNIPAQILIIAQFASTGFIVGLATWLVRRPDRDVAKL